MPSDLSGRLRGIADEVRAILTSRQVDQLAAYLHALTRWNQTINLTALPLGDGEDIPAASLERLIAEPLRAAALLQAAVPALDSATFSWVDVGSGSGSPAIPMKVCLPRLSLTMVESRGRKAAFLREAARCAGLDAEVFAGRFEAFPRVGTAGLVSFRGVRITSELVNGITRVLGVDGLVLSIGAQATAAFNGYETVGVSRDTAVLRKCST